MKYSIEMKFRDLAENEEAAAIFDQYLPGIRSALKGNPKALSLSIKNIVRYMNGEIPMSVLKPMEEALQALNTPENRISPKEAALIAQFQALDAQDRARAALPETHHQSEIMPGEVWYDTQGKVIQAHGGAVFYENGVYYWYGENKAHTDGVSPVWTWGIRMYSSEDLYNWKDLGLIIKPVLDDPESGLFPTKRVDRPHILKSPATGKYVCWVKLSGTEAAFLVFEADVLTGPYRLVHDNYKPQGLDVGDFDLICDETTGKGYLYYNAHSHPQAIVTMRLADDFLSAEEETARQYEGLNPPFTREAPCLFEADGRKYMFTSGMSGYIPNKSDLAVSDSWETPFVSIGNPHVDDASNASFNSQISKVFKVERRTADDSAAKGKEADLWIAMADRWVTDYPIDARRADVFERTIASHYDPEHYQATPEEFREMEHAPSLETANTDHARYVWLPVTFPEKGTPQLIWRDRWKMEDFRFLFLIS